MMGEKKVYYGKGQNDYVIVGSLSDELRFVELMKVYKAFDSLESALTDEAKERIRLVN